MMRARTAPLSSVLDALGPAPPQVPTLPPGLLRGGAILAIARLSLYGGKGELLYRCGLVTLQPPVPVHPPARSFVVAAALAQPPRSGVRRVAINLAARPHAA